MWTGILTLFAIFAVFFPESQAQFTSCPPGWSLTTDKCCQTDKPQKDCDKGELVTDGSGNYIRLGNTTFDFPQSIVNEFVIKSFSIAGPVPVGVNIRTPQQYCKYCITRHTE